ncbi:hypothetical protein AALO_G00093380 [Alosa alosa]|uniref:Uncharacterized protein n=1 Tax=Alosa alosa TaxID=278164 RepID=A0AAV6GVN3_9TELE|nr:hypothetical protein AALO_G00093380 [Alosa alosa]
MLALHSSVSLCQITRPPHAAEKTESESHTPVHTHECEDATEILICVFHSYITAFIIHGNDHAVTELHSH